MDTTFSAIANNIKARRTIKPSTMNGNKIPNGHIASILELADWAPNHGSTEPWRFIVFEDPKQFIALSTPNCIKPLTRAKALTQLLTPTCKTRLTMHRTLLLLTKNVATCQRSHI
jgi:hypothetical protein